MKKLLLSAAVAMAMGASVTAANAASTILFDMNGAAAGGVISVNTFDWLPDNALAVDAIAAGGIAPGPFNVRAQAKLGQFVQPGNIGIAPSVGEFTVVLNFNEAAFAAPGGVSALLFPQVGGTVQIFFDAAADSNQLAGTGYDNGTVILTGSIAGGFGTFADATRAGVTPTTALDNFNADDHPGVTTNVGGGQNRLDVNVSSIDSSFFLTNITGLTIDAVDSGQLQVPFVNADPAFLVGGLTPVRGFGGVNGGDCAAADVTCDFQFQTDNSTSFNVAPEPGSLALIALGLISLGGLARKRLS